MNSRFGWLVAAIAALSLACTPSEAPAPAPATGDRSIEIVGGELEEGHPAVGALTFESPQGYGGAFCTGTLIAPDWVLTAAHCTEGLAQQIAIFGSELTPDIIFFYVGTDARPQGMDRPEGDFYQAAEIFLHPLYNFGNASGPYDIALIRLAEEVQGVDHYGPLESDGEEFEGAEVLYVGFGNDDGRAQSGSGVKRSVVATTESVMITTYLTDQTEGKGACQGDSGGPGLVQVDGQWKVFGVVSFGIEPTGMPTCAYKSVKTRVDSYITWIRDTMGEGAECQAGGDDACFCEDGCGEGGVCDNALCGNPDCGALLECASGCVEPSCQVECQLSAAPAPAAIYDDLLLCAQIRCSQFANDPAGLNMCLGEQCAPEVEACMTNTPAPPREPLSCNDILVCQEGCSNEQCLFGCFQQGSQEAQGIAGNLAFCGLLQCGGNVTDRECLQQNCPAEWDACVADGGMVCEDADDDRACAEDDCADDDPTRFPGAEEICDDGIDQDCDGASDEGCPEPPCVDEDEDGVCVEDDCDDADAELGAAGDEGCPEPCVDVDADGVCVEDDCDDEDPEVLGEPCVTVPDDPGGDDGDEGSSSSSGCGCDVGEQDDPSWASLLLFAGLIGLRRRRR